MKTIIISILFLCLVISGFGQSIPEADMYFGQTPPGNTPVVFNLPITSGLRPIERIAISNDGKEIIYSELNTYPPTNQKIQSLIYMDGQWFGPILLFNGYMAPALSPNDSTLYMQKIINGVATTFYSTRNESGWSTPVKMFNFNQQSHYVQKTNLNRYYLSTIFSSAAQSDLASLVINETDTTIVSLGASINTNMAENDFFIARDESYIIHARSSATVAGDLFISFKKDDGTWTNSLSLGSSVNTPSPIWEYGIFVTQDDKYMFFTRGGAAMSTYYTYWVKIDNIIDSLKIINGIMPKDSLYMGQIRPGNTPQIFASGIVSVPGRTEYGISISPNGKEMLFALGNWPDKRTMIIEYKNNHWTNPDTIPFSETRSAEEAIFSPDGQRVYYYAYNVPNSLGGSDLCFSEKSNSVWGEPVNLGSPLNTSQDEYHPCVVADGSVYFENAAGKICYSKYQNGSYQPRVILPALFNDATMAWGNPYLSPDESYFLFNSKRPGGFGQTDLYISYKKVDGTWTNPKNLGDKINTSTAECGSEITPDGLYMTFVSDNDIYWVSSGFIDSLKHTNYIPYVNLTIPNQTDSVGIFFNYHTPEGTFFDDDGNITLTYSAGLYNGQPLPEWLSFDSTTCTFSGTPLAIGTLNILVSATDNAGASVSTSFKIFIKPSSAIHQMNEKNIQIFPNPSKGQFHISFSELSGKIASVEISNLEGRIILTDTLKSKGMIDLSDQLKGIYFIKLIIDNEVIVRKLCIE